MHRGKDKERREGEEGVGDREGYLRRCEWSGKGWEEIRGRGRIGVRDLEERNREVQKQERLAKIEKSRYNENYRKFRVERLPEGST